jgi:hypothetical protein
MRESDRFPTPFLMVGGAGPESATAFVRSACSLGISNPTSDAGFVGEATCFRVAFDLPHLLLQDSYRAPETRLHSKVEIL